MLRRLIIVLSGLVGEACLLHADEPAVSPREIENFVAPVAGETDLLRAPAWSSTLGPPPRRSSSAGSVESASTPVGKNAVEDIARAADERQSPERGTGPTPTRSENTEGRPAGPPLLDSLADAGR